MSKLSAALDYAAIGWPVFPCVEDGKEPIPHKEGGAPNGVLGASTDPDVISSWWEVNPEANIGFNVGQAGLMALDIDPEFEWDYEIPDTGLVVSSPRGGLHMYYRLSQGEVVPPSASKLAKGLDVRSHNSYVLLPPSRTGDGAYDWKGEGGATFRPDTLYEEARATARDKHENRDQWKIEPDLPENLSTAKEWLSSAARVAVEGMGGDATAYATAAHLRSFAISEEKAFALMVEHWNPRCQPPWNEDEYDHLAQKVRNAYAYATSPPGNITDAYKQADKRQLFTPKVDTENFTLSTKAGTKAAIWSFGRFTLRNRSAIDDIPPQAWILQGLLPADSYGILYAPPQSFKTFVALDVGLSVGYGYPALSARHSVETITPGPVIYMTGEGLSGISKRVKAWEKEHAHGYPVDGFFLFDPTPHLADNIDGLVEFLIQTEINPRLIIVDTISRILQGFNENDQGQASAVTGLADKLRSVNEGCSVLALHHVNKDGTMRGSSVFEGDADFVWKMGEKEREADDLWLTALIPEKLKDAPVNEEGIKYALKEVEIGDAATGKSSTLVAMNPEGLSAGAHVGAKKTDAASSKERQGRADAVKTTLKDRRRRSDQIANQKVIESEAEKLFKLYPNKEWSKNALATAILHANDGMGKSTVRRHIDELKITHGSLLHQKFDPVKGVFR